MIQLGQKVKDVVTGYTGITTAKIEFLNGCTQFLVQPKMVVPKKGEKEEYPSAVYIDVEQLVVVGKGTPVKLNGRKKTTVPSGGFRKYPD